MKTILSLFSIFLFVHLTIAQTTAIPDANFEQALIDLGYDTGTPDGVVLTANIDTITILDVSFDSISDLTGIEDFTALTFLQCYYNQLTSLDVTQNTALIDLRCSNNQLTSLDVTQNTALTRFWCHVNQLTSLGVSQNLALTDLSCTGNQLISLDVTQNTALTNLGCADNQLISLDVSQNLGLTVIYCSTNQLTSLDVSQNTVLEKLYCDSNQLTSLDVSQNPVLMDLWCNSNQLTSLNVKNGNNYNFSDPNSYPPFFDARGNPSLTCIEVDDPLWSAANWTSYIDPIASFSTNCSCPTLSVNIDSVSHITCLDSGKVFVSATGGVAPLRYAWVSSSPTYDSILTTDSAGFHYIQVIDSNNCNITKGVLIDGPKEMSGFDLNTSLNAWRFRPGRLSILNLSAWNDGCIVNSGQLSITYGGPITFSNSSITPDNINGNTLVWNFTNWDYNTPQFLSSLDFMVDTMANIGDSVCFEVVITPITGDADTSNNLKIYCFNVVNSYDPNDKQVYPQGVCAENYVLKTKPLTYTVRFQNTGSASAIDIYLLDTLSTYLDVNTLRVISQSHAPLITEITDGRIVKFRFDNINLADSFSNEPASHGYVTYEISPKAGLPDGMVIENSASIYFDFNPPVLTNSTMNTLTSILPTACSVGIKAIQRNYSNFTLYPNPTTGNITIDLGGTKTDIKATLLNNLGQALFVKQYVSASLISLNIDAPSGVYFLQLENDGEVTTMKVLKE